MEPLVSIIVPVYNTEKYLRECIESVLNQTYQRLELILIDDGTPDKSGEICDEYKNRDARVRVIHKMNEGLGKTRNVGLDLCSGDYIAFLDSDDKFAPDCIEFLVNICAERKCELGICLVNNFMDGDVPVFDGGLDAAITYMAVDEALEKWCYMDQIRTGLIGKLYSKRLKQYLYNPVGIYYEDMWPSYLAMSEAKSVGIGFSRKFGYRVRLTSQSNQHFSLKEMTCISEMERVYNHIKTARPQLCRAAASRALSANAHVFLKIPAGEYAQEQRECWTNIVRFRKTVIADKYARRKAKYFAVLSLCGRNITHYLGRKLVYRGE